MLNFRSTSNVLGLGFAPRCFCGLKAGFYIVVALFFAELGNGAQAQGEAPWRWELLPLPGEQVSVLVDGDEVTRWHYGQNYPRPFLFPLNGPSGVSLTRMGHPGAPNHDHHRSVWFAHNSVNGFDFWSDLADTKIRQKHWLAYEDGDDEAVMAVRLGWYDPEGQELMEQDVVLAVGSSVSGGTLFEIQTVLRPSAGRASVVLGKTNFGLLAVRVAKSLSVHFGGGQLTDSEGRRSEASIFGKQSRWVDYSGPVAVKAGDERRWELEGVTYFDHPDNPRYPSYWHVREDGWMGASLCFAEAMRIEAQTSLVLRYLLHTHPGPYDGEVAGSVHREFQQRRPFVIQKSGRRHRQFDAMRRQATDLQ